MNLIVFDIETGPLPAGDLLFLMPEFEAPKNFTDPAKIVKAIAEKQMEWMSRAALDATTGRVLAIGYTLNDGPVVVIGDDSERDTILQFWGVLHTQQNAGLDQLIGFYSHKFDLPFLIRRSILLGILADVPGWLRSDRYWGRRCVDLAEIWTMHIYGESISLDRLSRAFGLAGKIGSGADFARLWIEDRRAAVAYLEQDVSLTQTIAVRMGLIHPALSQESVEHIRACAKGAAKTIEDY